MAVEKGAGWHAAQLNAHLRNAHDGTLRLQIRDYLLLFRLVNGDTYDEEVILMAVNDALRNALNHFAESCEACFQAKTKRMDNQLFLGRWHFSLASLLTLLPFLDLFDHSIGLIEQYLAGNGTSVRPDIRRTLRGLRVRNGELKARARTLREERRQAGAGNPPKRREAARLEKLVEDLGSLVDELQRVLDTFLSDYPEIPPLIKLSTRSAAV